MRRAIVQKYGDIGQIACFLVDIELAAIDAIRQVLPATTIKGCTFPFRQAIMCHVADEGLQMAYNTNNPPEVKDWFRHIMGMSMLPFTLIERAWASLRQPPPVEDSSMFDKIKAFALYFERTWKSGSYPPTLWTHFDNCGPRTTNVAEGWHNFLNHRFGMPHPSMRNFMHWLQKC